MPFGKWKDFGECVQEQMDKGNSKEVASKICGALKRDLEDK